MISCEGLELLCNGSVHQNTNFQKEKIAITLKKQVSHPDVPGQKRDRCTHILGLYKIATYLYTIIYCNSLIDNRIISPRLYWIK